MPDSFVDNWCEMRERRRNRLLAAIQTLEETPPTVLAGALHVHPTPLEPSWFLIRRSLWNIFATDLNTYSIFAQNRFSDRVEYIFIQIHRQNLKRQGKSDYIDKGIAYLNKKQAEILAICLLTENGISQFFPLTAEGLPDSWAFFQYYGGTNEGILIYENGVLKDLRKRPFGSTLDVCIPLSDAMIQEYRKEYERQRHHDPGDDFDVWGSHWKSKESEILSQIYRLNQELQDFLKRTDSTRRLMIQFRAAR